MPRITPFMVPTKWSLRPKSVVRVRIGRVIVYRGKMDQVQHFYFDHNATTPVAPEVMETLVACLGQVYGNASSIHHFGQAAKQRLEAARRQVAALINASAPEIVFTSGGTEADNLAIFGVTRAAARPRKHVITCAIEHPAVLSPAKQLGEEGVEVTCLRVGSKRDRQSRRCAPRAASGDGAGLDHARQQRARHAAARRRDRADRARGRRGAARRWRAGARQDAGGRAGARRRPVHDERSQTLRAEGRGRALRPQGHPHGADLVRRTSRARPPPGDGERSGHRGIRRGGGTRGRAT